MIILDFAVESGVDLHRYVCVDDVSVPLESSKQGNSSNLEKLLNSLEVGCTWVTAGVQQGHYCTLCCPIPHAWWSKEAEYRHEHCFLCSSFHFLSASLYFSKRGAY